MLFCLARTVSTLYVRTATKAADSLTVAARTGGEVNSPRNIINFIRSVRTRGIAAVRTATFRCITFRNRALTLYQVRLADSAYDYLCHFDQVSNANARRNLALLIDFSTSALRACGQNDKQGGGRRRMCAARRVLLYTVIYTVIRPAMRACGLPDPQNKPNRNRCSEL